MQKSISFSAKLLLCKFQNQTYLKYPWILRFYDMKSEFRKYWYLDVYTSLYNLYFIVRYSSKFTDLTLYLTDLELREIFLSI